MIWKSLIITMLIGCAGGVQMCPKELIYNGGLCLIDDDPPERGDVSEIIHYLDVYLNKFYPGEISMGDLLRIAPIRVWMIDQPYIECGNVDKAAGCYRLDTQEITLVDTNCIANSALGHELLHYWSHMLMDRTDHAVRNMFFNYAPQFYSCSESIECIVEQATSCE